MSFGEYRKKSVTLPTVLLHFVDLKKIIFVLFLQLLVVLVAIIIGARLGGIGLGVMGGVGLAILSFVFGLQPTRRLLMSC